MFVLYTHPHTETSIKIPTTNCRTMERKSGLNARRDNLSTATDLRIDHLKATISGSN